MDQYTKIMLTIITVCVVVVTLIIVGSVIVHDHGDDHDGEYHEYMEHIIERLENIIDFTGNKNDYVVFTDLQEHFKGSGITPKKVGDALTKMGIKKDLKRLNGKPRLIRLGIKLKDFENGVISLLFVFIWAFYNYKRCKTHHSMDK